ncbi:hypothetical protein ACMGDM_20350 [Sphingomonas sp. DT-51]|uniref:hypothetical protein n=1 Tax=Sphingomonas sp. DT-51 TaxID=3396165 RepID=UPI003F1D9B7D
MVDYPALGLQAGTKAAAAAWLNAHFSSGPTMPASPVLSLLSPWQAQQIPMPKAAFDRLLRVCPCLYNQIKIPSSARAIVHFCELTLGTPITSANVHDAFLIQHPHKGPGFNPGPAMPCGAGGAIMESLCSEVLTSAGIPAMFTDATGWPIWKMPGHVLMNSGKMASLQALGDILIPCAPTNLVISIKSEVARERLLYSANSIEGVGFGFFKEPEEFWTSSRMSLYKRMGFSAIYMPDATHAAVMNRVLAAGNARHAVNINGTDLYRPLSVFGDDMKRVVGRSSALL